MVSRVIRVRDTVFVQLSLVAVNVSCTIQERRQEHKKRIFCLEGWLVHEIFVLSIRYSRV